MRSRRANRKWRTVALVELSDVHGDALLFREAVLSLQWPRSCPEFLTDEEVSIQLRKFSATFQPPWAIDDRDLFWSDDHE